MSDQSNRPNPLLDPFVPAVTSWAIVTASNIGVFEAIANGNSTLSEIARETDIDPAGIKHLLEILIALDYLDKLGDAYSLTDVTRQTLLKNSPHRLKYWAQFCRFQLLVMQQLENALVNREKVNLFDLMGSQYDLWIHQMAMAETAAPASDWVAANIPVSLKNNTMLDVGGSHGIYSAAICQKNLALKSEILELPEMTKTQRRSRFNWALLTLWNI